MVWDSAEANILGEKGITWLKQVKYVSDAVSSIIFKYKNIGNVLQENAEEIKIKEKVLISTDPPYGLFVNLAAVASA